MSEQKWITITVPVTERPSGGAGQAGAWTEYDGRKGLWVARDERERLVWSADIQKAMVAAWSSEPTTDYATRLAEIVARLANKDWLRPEANPVRWARQLAEDGTTLLAQLRAVDAALTAAGVPSDGRTPAERIGDLGERSTDADRALLTLAGAKFRPVKVLDSATRAAIVTMGGTVPEDAGPETIASTLRQLVDDSEEAGRDFAETQRKMQAEIDRLTEATESAGASAVSERARADRAEEERDAAQAALRAAKVLAEDGTPGESAADILRAAEMLRRWENGVTVEHDCGGSPTCPMCVSALDGLHAAIRRGASILSATVDEQIEDRLDGFMAATAKPAREIALRSRQGAPCAVGPEGERRWTYETIADLGFVPQWARSFVAAAARDPRWSDRLARLVAMRDDVLAAGPVRTDEEEHALEAKLRAAKRIGLVSGEYELPLREGIPPYPGDDAPEPHRGRVVAWHDSARVDGWSVCTTDADGLGDESLVEGLTEAQAKTVAGLVNGSPEPQAASRFDPNGPPLDPGFRSLSPSPRPPLAMILAVANNGVIGKDGKIPWPISEDLRHFKKTTMGHTLIVGRKTYEGLPPLAGRRLVGVSRKHPLAMMNAGIRVCPTIEDAIGVARETDPEPIVIGGAEVCRAALPYVTRIYLTEIGHDYEGDTTFHLDRTGWRETSRRAGETPGVSFVVLERSEMEERLRRMAQPPPEPDIDPAVGDCPVDAEMIAEAKAARRD